jgi:hypothetical protein
MALYQECSGDLKRKDSFRTMDDQQALIMIAGKALYRTMRVLQGVCLERRIQREVLRV